MASIFSPLIARHMMQSGGNMLLAERGLQAVPSDTVPTTIPDGWVLLHNDVPHAADTPCGLDGFRAYYKRDVDGLVPCDCGWPGLPHYVRPTP